MKVFISWSGSRSRLLADAIRNWLPKVLQAIDPWMSDEDISTGARWSSDIAGQLSSSNVGLICVTPENMESPWLLFEAGALSKTLSNTFVCPVLLGMSTTQLGGPLSQFQAVQAHREGILRVITTLNKASPSPLNSEALDEVFEVWWPRLEVKILAIPAPANPLPKRSSDELMAELLELSREHLRRDNLRIEHSKERDKQLDKIREVMDTTAKNASRMFDARRGPLAALQRLANSLPEPETLLDREQALQLAEAKKMMMDEFSAETPFEAQAHAFRQVAELTRAIDGQDQEHYRRLLNGTNTESVGSSGQTTTERDKLASGFTDECAPTVPPNLPDRLSADPSSPHHVAAIFEMHDVGIRLNGKERFDVEEYCISEGWVKVAVGKKMDRKGRPLLTALKGKVEAFYR